MTNWQCVGLGAVGVAIWYWSDWERARADGRTLFPLVHPLALVVLAARRLWQERTFLVALLVWLLLSTALDYGVSRPLLDPRPLGPILAPPASSGHAGPDMTVSRPGLRRARAVRSPYQRPTPGLSTAVRQSLQRLKEGPYQAWQALQYAIPGKDLFVRHLWRDAITNAALMLLVVMVLLRLWRAQPDWLGRPAAGQVPTLLAITSAGFVLQTAFSLWVLRGADTVDWLRFRPLINIADTLVALAHCVAYGFLWHCVMQIARRGKCSYALAIRAGLIVWLPMLIFFAIIRAPTTILQSLSGEAIRWLPYAFQTWFISLLPLALLFVPWLIVQHRLSFREAWRWQLTLVRTNPKAALMFLLRTVLIFAPLYLLTDLLAGGDALTHTVWLLLSQAVNLLAMMVVALWLLEFEKQAREPLGLKMPPPLNDIWHGEVRRGQ